MGATVQPELRPILRPLVVTVREYVSYGGSLPPVVEWTPVDLFASNEQGAFFSASDLNDTKLAWKKNWLTNSESRTPSSILAISTPTQGHLAPDGTTSAWRISEDATAASQHRAFIASGANLMVSGNVYAFAVHLKPDQRTWVKVLINDFAADKIAYFDLTNSVVGTVIGTNILSTYIEAAANGYKRCVIVFRSGGTGGSGGVYGATADNVDTYNGVVDNGFWYWGASLNPGYTAMAYQRTTNPDVDFLAAFPTHALFQDSTGITPVTGTEQPVGMVLDKRLGSVLGANTATTGYTNGGAMTTFTVAGTVLTAASAGYATCSTNNTKSVVNGRIYKVVVDVTSYSGTIRTTLGTIGGGAGYGTVPSFYRVGLNTFYITATNTTILAVMFEAITACSFVAEVVSYEELSGNHLTQATTSLKPTWSARKNLVIASAAPVTQNITTIAASYTLSHTGTGTITLSGTSTAGPLVGAGSITFTPTAGSLTLTMSGTVTNVQLERGSSATSYQDVITASQYNAIGFPKGLRFDGIDDLLINNSLVNTIPSSYMDVRYAVTANAAGSNSLASYETNRGLILGQTLAGNLQTVAGNGTTFGSINSAVTGLNETFTQLGYATATTIYSKKNRSAETSTALVAVPRTANGFYLGRSPHDVNSDFGGFWMEGIVIDRALTEPEKTAMIDYNQTKAGVIFP